MTMRFTGDADRGATRIEERCGYRRDSNRASPNEERLLQQSSDTGWEHACAFDRKSVHLACLSVSLALYSVAWYGSDLRVKPDPDGRDQSSSHTSALSRAPRRPGAVVCSQQAYLTTTSMILSSRECIQKSLCHLLVSSQLEPLSAKDK